MHEATGRGGDLGAGRRRAPGALEPERPPDDAGRPRLEPTAGRTPDEVAAELGKLDGWTGDTDEIEKTFEIDYHTGIRIVVDVARTAKEVGHHPDIDIRWARLRFGITTHDVGHKVTVLDFDLAQRIDAIAAEYGAVPVSE